MELISDMKIFPTGKKLVGGTVLLFALGNKEARYNPGNWYNRRTLLAALLHNMAVSMGP